MNIIIIALGAIPNFLNDCVKQIKFTQKNPIIHIIKNETSDYKNNDCKIVDVENIPASQKHFNFIKESELINKNFRDYFWRYSSERLYVLDDYLQMQNLKDVITVYFLKLTRTSNLTMMEYVIFVEVTKSKFIMEKKNF